MIYERYSDRICGKLENLNKLYAELIYQKTDTLQNPVGLTTLKHFRTPPKEDLSPLTPGTVWGEEYGNLWVKGDYTVPERLAGQKLYVIPHTEAYETLFFINGEPQGLFNSKGDYMGMKHSAQLLAESALPGQCFSLAFECYANHFCVGHRTYDFYGDEIPVPNENDFRKTFTGIDICTCDQDIHDFVIDLNLVIQMAKKLDSNNFQKHRAQAALEQVLASVIQYPAHYDSETVHRAVVRCLDILRPVLAKGECDNTRGRVGLIGHSHMDTAWLWPVSETIRKCARTYSNVVRLMDRYPEYKFIQSSALHSDWMRRYYPSLFERIKKYIKEGRYEPNGGVWVECDCNITSGELMARQFMYGQHFTREFFDYTSDAFWLPDTFGYNAAIPQIMQESEVKYFYTTKMSWNDLNQFPLTTFRWKGIDGSTVLTHLNRVNTSPDVSDTDHEIRSMQNKEYFEGRLISFGYGDGGGGPTPAMLEKARRIQDLPGLPHTYYTTVSDFMKEIEAVSDKLPVYNGELYLELHRGTLTQMHGIKRTNRKCEFALRDMDYFNVLAGKPKGEHTDELYKILLQNQFHDILPGTCYTGVTQNAIQENIGVIRQAKSISQDYIRELLRPDAHTATLFNTTSFDRDDVIFTEDTGLYPREYPCQCYTDVTGRQIAAVGGVRIGALSSVNIALADAPKGGQSPFLMHGRTLETPFASVRFEENGTIASFIDKQSGRELRREGGNPLNSFYIAEDVPKDYDNWDIDLESLSKLRLQNSLNSFSVISDGALMYVIRVCYPIGQHSTLTQDIRFYATSPRVDFHTVVDWKEKHTLLKVGFDLDIHSMTMKNEIQFGHIDRPTTRNDSWETAKFEVCNHKWTDLSESRFGVAILNDCKYGISAEESNLCLTLLKSGTHPDVTGDAGVHEFTYSLYPHNGGFTTQNVVRESYLLNIPAVIAGGSGAPEHPLMTLSADHIICEAIKPAALRDDACVARLYEAEGCKTVCQVGVPKGTKAAYRTNILEDIKEELPVRDGAVTVPFRPFGIVTLMFVR